MHRSSVVVVSDAVVLVGRIAVDELVNRLDVVVLPRFVVFME